VITYRASLDVPADTVHQVACWLAAHCKAHDVRPWQRAATPFVQAVMRHGPEGPASASPPRCACIALPTLSPPFDDQPPAARIASTC
jgi:hypothetical protein